MEVTTIEGVCDWKSNLIGLNVLHAEMSLRTWYHPSMSHDACPRQQNPLINPERLQMQSPHQCTLGMLILSSELLGDV